MFLNNLFTIANLTFTSDTITADIVIDADHQIFEGHFPNSPVTPGVVQLQIVKEIVEQHLGRKLRMKTMRTCKFLQIINPKDTPSVCINIKYNVGEVLEVVASATHLENTYFKAQVSYF